MSKTWDKALPYFSENELACQGTGVICLDIRFAARLPQLRAHWGQPLSLNSCCRTPEHNQRVKGHYRSLHLTVNPEWPTWGCMAADIDWEGWSTERRYQFAKCAWELGWSLGLHDSFCHIDMRAVLNLSNLPQWVFYYDSWDGDFMREDIF